MLVLAALCGAPSAAPAQAAAPAAIAVAHPYAWPTPPGGTSGAVYLRELVNRGTEADALVGVSSPGADRVELHTMQMDGDVMRMRALPSLPLAAGARVTMAPGSGYHLMFTGIRAPWKIGDRIPLTLQFRRAGRFETTVVVEPRSAAAPVPHGHDAPMPMRMPMPMSPGVGDR